LGATPWSPAEVSAAIGVGIATLEQCEAAFEEATFADDTETRRAAREARRSVALDMALLVARLGELELLRELERGSTRHKVQRLKQWLGARQAETLMEK
jgi:hypothetical protein